jgi:RNA polymerase sigma-70 factor (ECF subfamily)
VQDATADDPARDDAELVALAQRDRQAFALLYRRYVGDVYRFCDRRLGSREAAEDATATTFKRALEAIDSCRDGSAFRSWLFAIARNVVNDSYRVGRSDRSLDEALARPGSAIVEQPDGAPSPEELALAGEERRQIWDLLARLPRDDRDLLALRLQGLTDKEIAVALGRSHGAIRTAQYRALGRIRKLLGIPAGKEARRVER